jgi:NTP pyrophosphatase (non-canonical NTP hydrolase)
LDLVSAGRPFCGHAYRFLEGGLMDFNEYQRLALRTYDGKLSTNEGRKMASIGLAGETGEVLDMVKKHHYHGHPMLANELAKELGDVLWYLAVLAELYFIDLDSVASWNIEKLKKR